MKFLEMFLISLQIGTWGTATAAKKVSVDLTELKSIQQKLQGYQDLSLKFEQSVFKQLRKRTTKNSGQAIFKKPHYFRWVFNEPEQEEWLFDGWNLIHYFPKKGYAHRYKAEATKGRSLRELVDMVLNFDKLLQKYKVTEAYKEGTRVFLSLTPNEKGDIEKVDLNLDLEKRYLTDITMHFPGGNHSTFRFSSPQFSALKQESFTLPAAVKITDAL
ncbi:MAG: outer membrane lipoprotein carrier protein LolA [Deltaproteobacteria bacterium]|nr:outer membrane lipoprotein carrier protein LolA [Deltaproteobacteria bacterium]